MGAVDFEGYALSVNNRLEGSAMRAAFAASALCFVILICAVRPAASQTAAPIPSSSTGADAAAKHAKRTACLQESKTRKLVGADKTAFLKTCIGAPETISASRVTAPDRP
jgi:hypothetical protein